jgi:hypothetical protein
MVENIGEKVSGIISEVLSEQNEREIKKLNAMC